MVYPTSFRIVTNASQIADKFENTTCRGDHFHTTSKEATEWNPQISEKLALGITELIENKRIVVEASNNTPKDVIHRSFLAQRM